MSIGHAEHQATAPFPGFPSGLRQRDDADGMMLRAFGRQPADLDIAFDDLPPLAVTEVLAAVTRDAEGRPPSHELLWELPVGCRTQALITAAVLGEAGRRPRDVRMRCANPSCGQSIEVELDFSEVLAALAPSSTGETSATCDGRTVRLRLPTGADQLSWLDRGFADEDEAGTGILASLILDGAPAPSSEDWNLAIESALTEQDPYVGFEVTALCPDCGEATTVPVDLAGLALDAFAETQSDLVEEVHTLASRYHWSEDEIVALPAWRRARYLALIEREEGL
jgi:hypothetical protein